MVRVSAMLYELTAEDVMSLPRGFQVIEKDTLNDSISVIAAREDRPRDEGSRFVYFSMKVPPMTFGGRAQASKLVKSARKQEKERECPAVGSEA